MESTQAGATGAQQRKPRAGDEFEVEVAALEPRGGARAQWGEYRVRFARALPGARVRARVVRRHKQRIEARVLEVLVPAPQSCAPRCAHFGRCGGCSYQDLDYGAQLAHFEQQTRAQLATLLAPGERLPLEAIQGCEQPWNYRNKMDFTFSARRWVEPEEPLGAAADFALGLHLQGLFHKVLDIRSCEIQHESFQPILASARELARSAGLSAWHPVEHHGCLRHLVLRAGVHSGEILVHLVTSGEQREAFLDFARALLARHASITTLVHSVRKQLSTVAVGESEETLFGPGFIHETLGGTRFRVSASSFFQVNTLQAEKLVERVRRAALAQPVGRGLLLDLCCGAGTLSLPLARDFERVLGLELVPAAVEDARVNAAWNGIHNADYRCGDVGELLAPARCADLGLTQETVVLVDPPRAGLPPAAVQALEQLLPRRLVYVSCNLLAAERDLARLAPAHYRLVAALPIDLFPHTPHLECVLELERRR